MVTIEHSGRGYSAARTGELFSVEARYTHTTYSADRLSPRDAWMWLGNHGLPRRKIRKITGLPSVPQLNGDSAQLIADSEQLSRI